MPRITCTEPVYMVVNGVNIGDNISFSCSTGTVEVYDSRGSKERVSIKDTNSFSAGSMMVELYTAANQP